MTRDYSNFDRYYNELISDIYAQPPDDKHTDAIKAIVLNWINILKIDSVLDVGCGEGIAQDFLRDGIQYEGIAIGADVIKAQAKGRNVVGRDFNFLEDYGDDTWNLILARHALEHSPFPLLTLMEWHRVSSKWLCVVLPNPEHYTFTGRNHYSVMEAHQAGWILRRAGWKLKKFFMNTEEIWFLCEKKPRISYEGWAKVPLTTELHEFERDKFRRKNQIIIMGNYK